MNRLLKYIHQPQMMEELEYQLLEGASPLEVIQDNLQAYVRSYRIAYDDRITTDEVMEAGVMLLAGMEQYLQMMN